MGSVSTGPNSDIEGFMRFVRDDEDFVMTEVLPGDFNSSSAVDARDYLVYRQENGLLAPLMVNYETWKANYGETVSNVSSIPEPATFMLLMQLCVIGRLCFDKRLRNRQSSFAA